MTRDNACVHGFYCRFYFLQSFFNRLHIRLRLNSTNGSAVLSIAVARNRLSRFSAVSAERRSIERIAVFSMAICKITTTNLYISMLAAAERCAVWQHGRRRVCVCVCATSHSHTDTRTPVYAVYRLLFDHIIILFR